MKVLLIEDNGTVRALLVRAMPGVTFIQADTLAAGMASLRRNGYDAVLLDINLPDAKGGSSINHIKEMRQVTDRPIVILSGSDDPADIDRAIAEGANAYLTKRVIPAAVVQIFITLYVTIRKGMMK